MIETTEAPAASGTMDDLVRQFMDDQSDAQKRQKARSELATYKRVAGPPAQFADVTMSHLDDRECSRAGVLAATRYVETWPERRAAGDGLIFSGEIGTGKTMVGVAIANTVAMLGESVRFIGTSELQSRLKDRDRAADLMADLKRGALLVLDDFGQERPTEWSASQFFELIAARHQAMLPTIVTTNLGAAQLREHYIRSLELGRDQMPADQAEITVDRILSRIRERNAAVLFTGPDQRAGKPRGWLDGASGSSAE